MTKTIIENVRIIDADQDFVGTVTIENGKISKIAPGSDTSPGSQQKILMPGFVDPHVHFRTPGLEYKETFHTGSMAAASGGVTTVFDMPNTKPPVFSKEELTAKREIVAEQSLIHWGLFFGASDMNSEEILKVTNVPGVKLYCNTTTGNLKIETEDAWKNIFNAGKKVTLHAEEETFAHVLKVWESIGMPCELHLAHTSRKMEVKLLREIKKKTNKVTAEVCPHHLFLTQKDFKEKGNFALMKPELGMQEDLDALWEGIEDGTIDCFATDHAPHSREEKQGNMPVFGIPSVDVRFALLFTEWNKRGWDLKKFSAMMSSRALNIYKVKDKKGFIRKGYDADLVLIDPHAEEKIDATRSFSKAKWSPFQGFSVKGRVEKTFVNGTIVFENGKILDEDFRGQEIQF
jgi:dihydroorotase